jgi:hypothetical protein
MQIILPPRSIADKQKETLARGSNKYSSATAIRNYGR